MINTRNVRVVPFLRALLLVLASASAHSADYPAGPVRIIVPFAPGAGTDAVARVTAPALGKILNAPVIVENVAGAGGNLGTEQVVRAKPDGQTLLLSGIWVPVNKHLYKDMRIDPVAQLTHVALMARQPLVLVVNPEVKATTLKELVQLAKNKPDALSYGSAGAGNQPHLLAELFKASTGTTILPVPFKGSGPALTAVISGHVSMIFLGTSSTVPHIKAGKVRALAITGTSRSPLIPEVPTLHEAGLPVREFDNGSWWGISVPAQTPKSIVEQLNRALNSVLADPDVRSKMAGLGIDPQGGTSDQYDKLVRAEATTWQRVIQSAGLTAD